MVKNSTQCQRKLPKSSNTIKTIQFQILVLMKMLSLLKPILLNKRSLRNTNGSQNKMKMVLGLSQLLLKMIHTLTTHLSKLTLKSTVKRRASSDTDIDITTTRPQTQSAHQLDTHVIKTKRSLHIQLATRFQTLELMKTSSKLKSTLLRQKRSKNTSGFQSKTKMEFIKFQLLIKDSLRSHLTQSATQQDAQRANGSQKKMAITFSTQILLVSTVMMKTSLIQSETK